MGAAAVMYSVGGFAPVQGPTIPGYVAYGGTGLLDAGCPTSSPSQTGYNCQFWAPSSPLQAIQTLAPGAQVNPILD